MEVATFASEKEIKQVGAPATTAILVSRCRLTGAKISDFFEYMHILTENVRHKMWICVQKS